MFTPCSSGENMFKYQKYILGKKAIHNGEMKDWIRQSRKPRINFTVLITVP
jgi:hypothetical protein